MKNTKQIKPLKCIRAKCQNYVFLSNKFAKQMGLCENHFNTYQHQYFHCDYCNLLSKRKKSTIDNYCSHKCQRLDNTTKQNWFKVLSADINHISINLKNDSIRTALFYSLKDESLIEDIRFLYELKKSKKNQKFIVKRYYSELKNPLKTEQYFSILDVSICHHSTMVVNMLHFITPTKIINKIKQNNFLLEMIKSDEQESFMLFNHLDLIFSAPSSNKKFLGKPNHLEKFIFSFSKEEPYNQYPILKLLYHYLDDLEEQVDTKVLKNSEIHQLSASIIEIERNKKSNRINPLYIELLSLILLYSLVFRNVYEGSFIELSELLINIDNNKIEQNIANYLHRWFGIQLPNTRHIKDKYYLEFYQSLFLVYKQEIPNTKANT